MIIRYTIYTKNGQKSKADTFDEEDTISFLYSRAKQCLNDEEFDNDINIISIDGKIIDENMLVSDYVTNENNSSHNIKLYVEKKNPIQLYFNKESISINAFENMKIVDSPDFCEKFQGNIDSYKFQYNGQYIDITQTPKQLGINPDGIIIAFNSEEVIPENNSQFFIDFSDSSQSFDKKNDLSQKNMDTEAYEPPEVSDDSSEESAKVENEIQANQAKIPPNTSLSNISAASSFSIDIKHDPEVVHLEKHEENNNESLAYGSFSQETPAKVNEGIDDEKSPILSDGSPSPSILFPENQPTPPHSSSPPLYSATVSVRDAIGNNEIFHIEPSNDASKIANILINLTALDVIDAYCSRCGIENEALLLFTSKWKKLNIDTPIWKLFLRKKRVMKDEHDKKKNDEQSSIEDSFTKIVKNLNSNFALTAEFCIRQNKEMLTHFDVLVGGIPFEMKEDQLLEYFKKCGNITNIIIFKNKKNESRGFARMTFEKEIDANKAIEIGKTLRYQQQFLHVFRPKLQFATSSVKKKSSVFFD